ncbi:MAG: hypothetical protein ACT4O9_01825 [Blastocatellia bacterium]
MLVIRDAQLQNFIAVDERGLIKVVCDSVRRANPERVAGYADAKLTAMVKVGLKRARKHQISKAQDIAAFVAVMFETSPRFDEQAEIAAVLADINFPPAERFYQLFERVSDEGWAEAERSYDEAIWFAGQS